MKPMMKNALALAVNLAIFSSVAQAQSEETTPSKSAELETITVTAQKRVQNIQEVPISIATLSGQEFDSLFASGQDIMSIALHVPGLYAESSNGRAAPRFYIRGLGNVDFDLAASQPVSIIMDEVVQENVVLKSFPLFDVQQVEVLRGPQGTLFGRNTTAGIIKFDTVKPTESFEGYAKLGYGSYNTLNFEGAVGGELATNLSGRISVLSQNRDDWIDNGYTGEDDAFGGYHENAWRAQLLYRPSDDFSALLNLHGRDLDGTASVFHANVFDTGSNDLNNNYDRDKVYYDGGDNNPQSYEGFGGSLKLDWSLDTFSITSITAFESAEGSSRGDIDGGVYTTDTSINVPEGIDYDIYLADTDFDGTPDTPVLTFPGTITVSSVTEDMADVSQFTQEIRFASLTKGPFQWQFGAFYFDSDLDVETDSYASYGFLGNPAQNTIINQENTTWAIFGQGSYDLTEDFNLTLGVRYTDDEKSFHVKQYGQLMVDLGTTSIDPIDVSDDNISWELSGTYTLNNDAILYGRVASGFRAQSIQARDVAFQLEPSVADSETILSYELGYKADLLDKRLRLNTGVFYYTVDDLQLSAIGGASNSNQLLNADKGEGYGFEVDLEFLVTENLLLTAGYSLNKTEIQDADLATAPCGSGLCTVTDPLNADGLAIIDGNPFQSAPETTFNATLRYGYPVANGEVFIYTDYVYQGETNMALYESKEFRTDGQFELGLRVGYENYDHNYTIALFGRNITDEDNVKGFIDFSNNTGFVNDPAIWGIEGKIMFF